MEPEQAPRPRGNRLEYSGWIVAIALAVLVVGYMLWRDRSTGQHFTPEQRAYIAAVATQQADAYIRALATQAAGAGQQVVAAPITDGAATGAQVSAGGQQQRYVAPQPPAAPVQPLPAAPEPTATPGAPPPPPPPPPAPTPTGSGGGGGTTPLGACVGYMVGSSSTGLSDCQQIAAGPDQVLGACIAAVIGGTAQTAAGKAACLTAAAATSNAYLGDCLLGLSGQSYYGKTACRLYYQQN